MSAWFFSRLIAWVKSGQLIEGVGYKLHRTPNGTSLILNPSKSVSSSATKIPGRFEISKIEKVEPESEGEKVKYNVYFENPYYDIGGKTYELPADESVDPPAVFETGVEDGNIIALRIAAGEERSAELMRVTDMGSLASLQDDVKHYTIPLYKISGGAVVCDFRTGPISAMGEF